MHGRGATLLPFYANAWASVQSLACCKATAGLSHLATLRQGGGLCATHNPLLSIQDSQLQPLNSWAGLVSNKLTADAHYTCAVPVNHNCPDRYDAGLLLSFLAKHPLEALKGTPLPQTHMLQD